MKKKLTQHLEALCVYWLSDVAAAGEALVHTPLARCYSWARPWHSPPLALLNGLPQKVMRALRLGPGFASAFCRAACWCSWPPSIGEDDSGRIVSILAHSGRVVGMIICLGAVSGNISVLYPKSLQNTHISYIQGLATERKSDRCIKPTYGLEIVRTFLSSTFLKRIYSDDASPTQMWDEPEFVVWNLNISNLETYSEIEYF